MQKRYFVPLFSLLFFLSGVAGLIYESIWTHYLKLFLGHAAYAQTLVLAIYMGGMAIGSFLAGKQIAFRSHLLERYAIVELFLGIAALFFHPGFLWYQNVSYTTILPMLGSTTPVLLYKWLSGALIILPQSMLLGATFPFMAAGFIRRFPGSSGYQLALLYFVNTFGASLGILLSGFLFIKLAGLHGTITIAGILDIIVGTAVLLLCRSAGSEPGISSIPAELQQSNDKKPLNGSIPHLRLLLIIAGATAASSFIYEIGWIRMLSLVLGSSTHSFEMMLSTFILGIALGSFFIRNKIDRLISIPRALVLSQVIMGVGALLSVIVYGKMFYLMQYIMSGLKNNDTGYLFFNFSSDIICMLIMLPSTICAGMVFPLIIGYFYRYHEGENYIGKIYAINTMGSIIGVILAIWLLMPVIGVRFLITFGAIVDIGIGLFILYRSTELAESRLKHILPVAVCICLAVSVSFGRVDPVLAASGVFRNGTITKNIHMLSHVDGSTATISLYKSTNNIVVSTNGKPDAGINYRGGICGDEYTMALSGLLPMAIIPKKSSAAIIGLGSGMTAHFLLYDTTLVNLDIIEIEKEMAIAARKIGAKVEKAFTDPRVHLHIDDAKSFFSTNNKQYDVIISEPSNPWVSGVSGLFSTEFFGRIKHHLTDNGILVQWFHRYESDMTIVSSMLGALGEHFPSYQIFAVGTDCIVVASKNMHADLSLRRDLFTIAPLADRLRAMRLTSMNDLLLLRFASEKTMKSLSAIFPAPPNSDYQPYIDLNAVRYRFIDDNIPQFDTLLDYIIPVRKIIEHDTSFVAEEIRDSQPELSNLKHILAAKKLYKEITASVDSSPVTSPEIESGTLLLDYFLFTPGNVHFDFVFRTIIDILEKTLPYLSVREMRTLWNTIEQKCSPMILAEDDSTWMALFKALCYYDLPALHAVSAELLPSTDWIDDDYVNRMLLTAFIISSSPGTDQSIVNDYLCRFTARRSPGVIIELCREHLKGAVVP